MMELLYYLVAAVIAIGFVVWLTSLVLTSPQKSPGPWAP